MFIFQEYSVQVTFREDWNDPRLKYNNYKAYKQAASKGTTFNTIFSPIYLLFYEFSLKTPNVSRSNFFFKNGNILP